MYEIETKVLGIDKSKIVNQLETLGANKILETRFNVDWFRLKPDDNWYLRIRTDSSGGSEVTWKGESDILGVSRKHKEINFTVSDPRKAEAFLLELGLQKYAHQEKDRISWVLKDWRFDLDQYPDMPIYLEIEGKDEEHIQEALKLLRLENHKTSSDGERFLIQKEYDLDWYNMKFRN